MSRFTRPLLGLFLFAISVCEGAVVEDLFPEYFSEPHGSAVMVLDDEQGEATIKFYDRDDVRLDLSRARTLAGLLKDQDLHMIEMWAPGKLGKGYFAGYALAEVDRTRAVHLNIRGEIADELWDADLNVPMHEAGLSMLVEAGDLDGLPDPWVLDWNDAAVAVSQDSVPVDVQLLGVKEHEAFVAIAQDLQRVWIRGGSIALYSIPLGHMRFRILGDTRKPDYHWMFQRNAELTTFLEGRAFQTIEFARRHETVTPREWKALIIDRLKEEAYDHGYGKPAATLPLGIHCELLIAQAS